MGIIRDLKMADALLGNCVEKLENSSVSIGDIDELLEVIGELDNYYKEEFCAQTDEERDLPTGTTYNMRAGISLEFYIEADDWHRISKAYRKLLKDKK